MINIINNKNNRFCIGDQLCKGRDLKSYTCLILIITVQRKHMNSFHQSVNLGLHHFINNRIPRLAQDSSDEYKPVEKETPSYSVLFLRAITAIRRDVQFVWLILCVKFCTFWAIYHLIDWCQSTGSHTQALNLSQMTDLMVSSSIQLVSFQRVPKALDER